MYQHDRRHVDVLLKDLGLQHVNSVQTLAQHDVTDEEPEPLGPNAVQQVQVVSCMTLVLQSISSSHNIHRERVVSMNVKPYTAEPCQIEEARQIFAL